VFCIAVLANAWTGHGSQADFILRRAILAR
jgi:hypothetical protein